MMRDLESPTGNHCGFLMLMFLALCLGSTDARGQMPSAPLLTFDTAIASPDLNEKPTFKLANYVAEEASKTPIVRLAVPVPVQSEAPPDPPDASPAVADPPAEAVPMPAAEPAAGPMVYRGTNLYSYNSYTSTFSDSATPKLIRRYTDETGRLYAAPQHLLPPAADPNDLQANPLHGVQSLGFGVQTLLPVLFTQPALPRSTPDPTAPVMRYGLQARPGIFYDTGYAGGGDTFNPATVALDGMQLSHQNGQLNFYHLSSAVQSVPLRMQLDSQSSQLLSLGPAQGYVDLMYLNGNQVQVRSAFARLTTGQNDQHGLLLGQAESAFGDVGSVPALIATGGLPVGAVALTKSGAFTGVPQLRYTRYWAGDALETTFSAEDQSTIGDTENPNGETQLYRWPAFATRLRYQGSNGFDSYQVSAIARPTGFNDSNFNDHFVTGWGIAGIARLSNTGRTRAVYLSAVGGRGIGGYIYGGTQGSVISSDTSISTLSNFGCYAAYQHVWYQKDATHNLSSNVAYGYVLGQTATAMDNRIVQQAWANLLWNVSDSTAYGFECQYGRRRISDGTDGDDLRIMFVFQISPSLTNTKQTTQDRSFSALSTGDRTLSQRRL